MTRRPHIGQRNRPVRLGRCRRAAGELDPPCQDSPTLYSVPDLIIKLANGYWRWYSFTRNFAYTEENHLFFSDFDEDEIGTPYDRTEVMGSRHGDVITTADMNLLVNLPNAVVVGGPPLGGTMSIVVTNNAGTSTTNVTATFDGTWSHPRWTVAGPLTVDGVDLSGYIAQINPVGKSVRLRWFINGAGDNPGGTITPANWGLDVQDGTDTVEYYQDGSPNWCARSASFGFGAGGPTATMTWAKQNPRGMWWNPGGGGSFVPISTTGTNGNGIPSGGSDVHLAEYGLASGTEVSKIYAYTRPFGTPTSEIFQKVTPFLYSVNGDLQYGVSGSTASVWREDYIELLVEQDASWAGGSNPLTWDWSDRDNSFVPATITGGITSAWGWSDNIVPQSGWQWQFFLSFDEVNPDDLTNCIVWLRAELVEGRLSPPASFSHDTYVWTASIDFSTHLEDEIVRVGTFTLNDDGTHPDHTGGATGARTFSAVYTSVNSDYSVTIPSSIDVEFLYKVERALGLK